MGPLGRIYPSLLAGALLLFLVLAPSGRPNQPGEQNSFSEAGPLQSPVPLSAHVLQALLATDAAKEGLAYASPAQRANPAQLFRAAEVHLQPGEADLVVIGVCPMCGADTAWFWIITSASQNPKVVLAAGGNSLEVLGSSTKGYRDIQSVWSSPSQTDTLLYHFNGAQYELHKRKTTKIPPHSTMFPSREPAPFRASHDSLPVATATKIISGDTSSSGDLSKSPYSAATRYPQRARRCSIS